MVSYPLGANDSKSLTDGIGRILKSNLGYMDMMHMQKSKKHTACILSKRYTGNQSTMRCCLRIVTMSLLHVLDHVMFLSSK